jgi:hypothetical protein
MTKATLRKFMIILLSAAALSGGLGADAAYARGGGGFGGGHMGGFGGGHMGGFGGGHMGGFGGGHTGGFGGGHMGGFGGGHMDEGFGRSHLGMGGGFGGALAGARVHPGRSGLHFHHRRWFGDYAWGPRCDYGTDYVMADPDCRLPY